MAKLLLKLIVLIVLGAGSALLSLNRHTLTSDSSSPQNSSLALTNLDTFQQAFDNQKSNIQVKQAGRIVKVLKEDNHGSRHQRFIVQLASGQLILIAHNIDLATKVENLKAGEMMSFYGEYEWNNKGGVVHWTHHDPRGSHPSGWLFYNNRKYD